MPLTIAALARTSRATSDIDGISDFAREPNGGMVVTASAFATTYREQIVTLAARHKLAAVYSARDFVVSGICR